MVTCCAQCQAKDAEIAALRAQLDEARLAMRELDKLCTLQKADLERVGKEREALEPNRAERLPGNELQLIFAELLKTIEAAPANDTPATTDAEAKTSSAPGDEGSKPPRQSPNTERTKKKGHGRRPLNTENLPVHEIVLDPDEVRAHPDRYRLIGTDSSERVAYREASYICIRLVRRKYIIDEAHAAKQSAAATDAAEGSAAVPSTKAEVAPEGQRILCAAVPGYFWPRAMADVSAITQVILSKYDMCLPLHRQERASPRCGFYLPRSTQCDWLCAAHGYLYRIVDAMMSEACRTSFCIATDATGAPVRMPRECAHWHLFVFIGDDDHVIFRPSREHSGAAITKLLGGFRGHLLSDASLIYDVLHREQGITEVCCWSHMRRYVWKCRASEFDVAMQGLAIISQLFKANRETVNITMPELTEERARRARPILDVFDKWIERVRPRADEKSPLSAALTYYDNQREGLRTFLTDGRLRLDNNLSEQQLRQLVLGLHNWNYFENESGLRWYAVFRSLIASCKLHDLEAKNYLEEVLRLAPHWSTTKMLELAPKYWARTRAELSREQRAIIVPPWVEPRESAARMAPQSADAA